MKATPPPRPLHAHAKKTKNSLNLQKSTHPNFEVVLRPYLAEVIFPDRLCDRRVRLQGLRRSLIVSVRNLQNFRVEVV